MIEFKYTPYLIPLLVAAAVSVVLAVTIWRRRPGTGVISFVVLMAAVGQWTLSTSAEITSTTLNSKLFFSGLAYVGISIVPGAWLAFILEYTGREKWLTRRNVQLLAIEPVIVIVLALTYDYQQIFRHNYALETVGGLVTISAPPNWAFWLHAVYSYTCLMVANFLLIQAFIRSPEWYRGQMGLLLVGTFIPLIGNVITVFRLSPIDIPVDLTPLAFAITGIMVGWSVYRYRLMDIVPIARHIVMDNISEAIMILDKQNRIVDINPAALRIVGLTSPTQVIGKLVRELIDQPALIAQYQNVEEARAEIALGPNQQQERHFEMVITPLRNRHEELSGRMFVLHEVTELKHAAEQIRAQNEALLNTNRELEVARSQAEEASRLKSEFLATMSHELRTPLNSVIGYADFILAMLAENLTDKQHDYLERIMSNGERLLALINDILDLSKIEAGHLDLHIQPFLLKEMLDGLQARMQSLADQKNLDLETIFDLTLPVMIKGDQKRLEQILTNLVGNAIRFTEKGQVKVCLNRVEGTQWNMVVSDTGVGIPPHALEFIFDEFRQVDGSYQREHGGTGLGLAIVRKLAVMMGGTVRVESEVGKGSTFTVQLPLLEPEPTIEETK
ncbi:MAG: PAS domain-containing protein [Chloroflexi bacterium]|nr:PAS domain-containing protein [Chloroflexota bacterium]